jgi:hypothetical protein
MICQCRAHEEELFSMSGRFLPVNNQIRRTKAHGFEPPHQQSSP